MTGSELDQPKAEFSHSIEIAARSVVESRMSSGSIGGLIAERALDHFRHGLFQYAFIRVGHAAGELLDELAASDLDPTHDNPGALLFRALRDKLATRPAARLAPDAAEWWASSPAARVRLSQLRRELSEDCAEALELRFSRGLTSVGAALALGISPSEVEALTQAGLERASQLLSHRLESRDHTLQGAVGDAFLLDADRIAPPRPRPRPPLLASGALVANRYEIMELLGAGAFADVYRARDREVTDHVVALKILRTTSDDARSVRRAMRELRLIASVFHPSVVQLKDHGWHEQHLWFVMPFYRGETLAARLLRGPLGRHEARSVFEPLAEALAAMHRAGVLHQDIKPDNVLLADLNPSDEKHPGSPGRVLPVLIDLGVAAKDAELILAGTPAYFAPEVAARFAATPDPPLVGPKADVFSLALTLRHALAPHSLPDATVGSIDGFVALRAAGPPRLREDVDPSLADLKPCFKRWLAFSPDDRPSAEEFGRELAALTKPQERAERRAQVLRWAVPTAAAVIMSFGGVVYGLSREASAQRVDAELARERAAEARERVQSISQSLDLQKARRHELERDVARLETEYERSRMTREQLARRLAQAEGDVQLLAERQTHDAQRLASQAQSLSLLKDQLAAAKDDVNAVRARRDELAQSLTVARQALEKKTAETDDAVQLRAELAAAQRASELADQMNQRLREKVTALEAQFESER